MAVKSIACPNCTALNIMPQVDEEGADLQCIACKFPFHVTKTGKLEHKAIAPRS